MSSVARPSFRGAAHVATLLVALQAHVPGAGAAVVLPDLFGDEVRAVGLVQPVNFDFLPDGRLLVVEQHTALIRVVVPGAGEQPPAAGMVSDVQTQDIEDGLLGIAVDPRWPEKPFVYVHHVSASTPNIKIARYALTGDLEFTGDGTLVLDSLSRRDVLVDLPNDLVRHNGGTIEFGRDDLLYIALGDDGVSCSAQDIHQLRGKILRIDIRGIPDNPGPVWPYWYLVPAGNPYEYDPDPRARLVWHRGLRNPWSFAFDPLTGTMAIGDVGDSAWEEVNVTNESGRNFGWPFFEGHEVLDNCSEPDFTGLAMPVHDYPHALPDGGRTVIIGGFASHLGGDGAFPPEYWGDVFFLDFYEGWLRRIEEVDGTWQTAPEVAGQPAPYAWGQGFFFVPRMRFGPDGGLWYLQGEELRRIFHLGSVDVPGSPEETGARLRLSAFPSPSAGRVTFEVDLPREGRAGLRLHDARGRVVRVVESDRWFAGGLHRIVWDGLDADGRPVAAGIYFATVDQGGERVTRRILCLPGTAR